MAGPVVAPPLSLRVFLDGGGDVIARLGAGEAAVLCASFDVPAGLRPGLAAEQRRCLAGYLDGGAADLPWPVDQRLVERIAWTADLLEDDRLAEEVEQLLRTETGLPWRLWPESWVVVVGLIDGADDPVSGWGA